MTTTTDTATELDERCIATIRTLCIDAIQDANSGPGHPDRDRPGRLHALAAVPALRPERSDLAESRSLRAFLRAQPSTLLWSMLHLTRVRAVDPDYEVLGQPALLARGPQALSASSTRRGAGASRVPMDQRRRGNDRPARHTARPRRWGWPWPASGSRPVTTATASRCSTSTSTRRPATADMMEGIASEAASFAGHQRLFEPVLDLRLQPDHDRGAHRDHLHGGCGRALHGVRLERDDRLRRERPRGRWSGRSTTSAPSTSARR